MAFANRFAMDTLQPNKIFNRITQIETRYHYAFGYMPTQLTISTNTPQTMTMNITDWIGSAAATLTTAFIPQAWQVWYTKHTADISLGMYALLTLGVALWLAYGALLESWPVIIANCITLLLAGAALVMKIKFG